MKKKLITLIALFIAVSTLAQSSQKKVLLQQIAALKVYGEYVHKGYSIARKGLNTISDFKNGEFGLHSAFFTTLKTVNPNIRNYEKVAMIIALQLKILSQCESSTELLYDDLFLGNEREYVERVFGRLMADCDDNLDQLLDVLSDSSLEMDDAERMAKIDRLHEQMLENFTFSKSFGDEMAVLRKSRAQEKHDIHMSRGLHKLNTQQ